MKKIALITLKVEWAKQNFDNLKVVTQRFLDENPYAFASHANPKTGHIELYFTENIKRAPDDISLIIGDIVHNLRSALDHLAYMLCVIGTNGQGIPNRRKPFRHVYFPTADGANEYIEARVGKVQGMSQAAQNAIDATQPYQGGKGHYLWLLNELDVADKHHSIVVADVRVGGAGFEWITDPTSVDEMERLLEAGRLIGGHSTPVKHGHVFLTYDPEFYKNAHPTFAIAFSEPEIVKGYAVLKTIQDLINIVEEVIPTFKRVLI